MRRSFLSRTIFQLHLWGGLALGLYIFLIGVTGSVLVFREEIVDRIAPIPELPAVTATATMEQIHSRLRQQYPEWHPWSLQPPEKPGAPYSSYLLRQGRGRMIFADTQGNVVAERNLEGTWFELFEKFHSNLLLPRGRLYNGVAGLLVAVLAISGAFLWWPAKGEWGSAFRIVRWSNWKGIVYDLHRVGGALTFFFVVLFCITGAYFTWPAIYRNAVAAVLPTSPRAEAPRITGDGPRLPLDALIASARIAVSDGQLLRVLVPQGSRQPVRVVFRHGEPRENHKTTQVTVHPQTAEVLTMEAWKDKRAGDFVVAWMGPLHTGHFGGPVVKVIWAVTGMALPGLFITGFLMWLNRVLIPRIRRRGRAAEELTLVSRT